MLRSEFNTWLPWAVVETGLGTPSWAAVGRDVVTPLCTDDDFRLIEHVYDYHPMFQRIYPPVAHKFAAFLYVFGGHELYADLDTVAKSEEIKLRRKYFGGNDEEIH